MRRTYCCGTWRRFYHWGLKEDPIIEDSKNNPVNEKSEEDTITVEPIDSSMKSTIASGPLMTFAPQINPFW